MPALDSNPNNLEGVVFVNCGQLSGAIVRFKLNNGKVEFCDNKLASMVLEGKSLIEIVCAIKTYLDEYNDANADEIIATSLSYNALYDNHSAAIQFDSTKSHQELLMDIMCAVQF